MSDQPIIPVDKLAMELAPERWLVAFERAERAFGGLVVDEDSDEFLAEVAQQLQKMIADDVLARSVEKGWLEIVGVDDDGEIEYRVTPLGESLGA